MAELVIDFSDMVQVVYATDPDIRDTQVNQGPWSSAEITIKNVEVEATWKMPLSLVDIPKYRATQAALRSGEIKQQYTRVIEYRVDEESEAKVSALSTALPIIIIVFLILVLACLWKIRHYFRSIRETKNQIIEEQ